MGLTIRLVLLSTVVISGGFFLRHQFGAAPELANLDRSVVSNNETSAHPNSNILGLASVSASNEEVFSEAERSNFRVSASAYGVYTTAGIKLDGVNENRKWPIASLTKLMTALVAREVMLLSDKIEIRNLDPEYEGTAGGFALGEVFSMKDLEKALLIVSSNAAGNAIAGHYGYERFIATMNSYAFKLGMRNTYFADPTGLSYKNQSTVEDLDKLVTYILINKPDIFKVTRAKSDTIYNYKNGRRRAITNINQFAGKANFIGGKTGTTPESVGNLISVFTGEAKTPSKVIILLGTENRFEETTSLLASWNRK